VHGERVDAMRLELVLLVLHQGDERTHDDSEPGEEQGGELVDDRLPAAGGHDDERVAALEHGPNRLPLPGAEILMTESLAQHSTGARLGSSLGHAVWKAGSGPGKRR
jgi:hypothetical protein